MTWREFGEIGKTLMARWPEAAVWKLPDGQKVEALRVYYGEIEDFDVETVVAVIGALAREGRDFMPPSGLLRRRVIEMQMDAPNWAEVYAALRSYSGRGSLIGPYARFDGNQTRLRAAREAMNPLVRAFIVYLGPAQLNENLNDRQHGEPRLREKWTAFVADARDSALLAGLPAPESLRRIRRANVEGPRQIKGGMVDVIKTLAPAPDPDPDAA